MWGLPSNVISDIYSITRHASNLDGATSRLRGPPINIRSYIVVGGERRERERERERDIGRSKSVVP